MKLARHAGCKGEGLSIWIIVILLLGGIVWFLYSSRRDADRGAHAFANEVANKVAAQYDERYLQIHMNPEFQISHPPSWRERLMRNLRDFGPLTKPIETTGDVQFRSQFFDPHGTFKSTLTYASGTEHLEFNISKAMSGWRIDEISITYKPRPTPTPMPVAEMSPSPTPTPTPTPTPAEKQRRKRR